jgi:multimeric flavodoxin WrbA
LSRVSRVAIKKENRMSGKSRNVLGIAGSPKRSSVSASGFLLERALEAATEEGATTRMVRLVDYPIVGCDGCGDCMNKKSCHLFGDSEDHYTSLYKHIKWADAFIFASPVYALGLPYLWKQWIDRCEPADAKNLDYQYYNYDVAADVKGKAFQGKVAGQIVTSGGIGQEWAMASLMPLWTNVKLSMVISVGISLIEYDEQPGIRSKPWGKGVKEAEFAIEIARQVGKRVTGAIGFSTFNVCGRSPRLNGQEKAIRILEHLQSLEYLNGQPFSLSGELWPRDPLILVVAGQAKADEARKRFEYIKSKAYACDVHLIAVVDQLPHFITREFVRSRIAERSEGLSVLVDWERQFTHALGLSENAEPYVLIVAPGGLLLRSVPGTYTLNEIHTEVTDALQRAMEGLHLPNTTIPHLQTSIE